MPHALQGQDAEEIRRRITHIRALRRREPARNPEQAEQPHDVIEPQRAAVFEIFAQQVDEHPIAACAQALWIHGREFPVLPLRGKCVRRTTGIHPQGQDILIDPCVAPAPIASEGQVKIQTDRHV